MDLYFMYLDRIVIARIIGTTLLFASDYMGLQNFVPFDKITLSKEGILKEHPDLKDKPDAEIKAIAIQRLKDKINQLGSENEIKKYVIEELTKIGYEFKGEKKAGFREQWIR